MDMEHENTDVFTKYRVEIVNSLDTDKHFIQSYLQSKNILDDEDRQLISCGKTRQERVTKMLDILALKGAAAHEYFVNALEFEHPALYEKITGKKAEARITPVPFGSKGGIWNWTTGIDGKSLIDFDRQFLAKQLDRAMDDLKCMTYWQSKVMEEKNALEKKLFEATDDLQLKEQYMQNLQEEIFQLVSERRATETEKSAQEMKQPMHGYLQELWRDNMEKSDVILSLQSNLLFAKEQIERLQKANGELASKNETFKNEILELTIRNDFEKRNSRQLSDNMASCTNESEMTKTELFDLKHSHSLMADERDALRAELECFQRWTEILNARFDIVSQEKTELEVTSEDLSSQFGRIQDVMDEMEAQKKWLEFKYERSSLEVERLKTTLKSLREQRNELIQAKQDAITEKNATLREKAQLADSLAKLQEKLNCETEKQNGLYQELQNKHCDLLEQMSLLENQLADSEKELTLAKLNMKHTKMANLSDDQKSSVFTSARTSVSSVCSSLVDDDEAKQKTKVSVAKILQPRNRESLIESIRRKVSCIDVMDNIQKGSSLPVYFGPLSEVNSSGSKTLPLMSKLLHPFTSFNGVNLTSPNSKCRSPSDLPSKSECNSIRIGKGRKIPTADVVFKFDGKAKSPCSRMPKESSPMAKESSPMPKESSPIPKESSPMPKKRLNSSRNASASDVFQESPGSVQPFRQRAYCLQESPHRRRRSVSLPAPVGASS